jgi:hypothetical protein
LAIIKIPKIQIKFLIIANLFSIIFVSNFL